MVKQAGSLLLTGLLLWGIPSLFAAQNPTSKRLVERTLPVKEIPIVLGSRRPLLAVWRQYQGRFDAETPYLRIAIWEEGRVLFAKDPKKWGHALQQGRVSAEHITELKKRIAETGVFSLKGNAYPVPDAGVNCLMVDFGAQKQIMYWDEVESPNYGANISPSRDYLAFKKCWKALNQIALESHPQKVEVVKGRFTHVPQSWYLEQPIQSK